MRKEVYKSLLEKANDAAAKFSDTEREYNNNNETFKVHTVDILSEYVAAVTMIKSSGLKVLFLFIYIKPNGNGWWLYFVPSDSHLLGLRNLGGFKLAIENYNANVR